MLVDEVICNIPNANTKEKVGGGFRPREGGVSFSLEIINFWCIFSLRSHPKKNREEKLKVYIINKTISNTNADKAIARLIREALGHCSSDLITWDHIPGDEYISLIWEALLILDEPC